MARLPTFVFKKVEGGSRVLSSGISKNTYTNPNLIFLRNSDYRFVFENKSSVIELYDTGGNILVRFNTDNFYEPQIIRFKKNYPEQIFYRIIGDTSENYGKILIRDFNKIEGRVFAYGYCNNTQIRDESNRTYVTENGYFYLDSDHIITDDDDFTNTKFYFSTEGGTDNSFIQRDVISYNKLLPFKFKASHGNLNIGPFSTIFYYIDNKIKDVNYRDIEKKMQYYFGLSDEFDPITDDPISAFLTNKIKLSDFKNYMLFTTTMELNSFLNGDASSSENHDFFYDKISGEIITKKFKFMLSKFYKYIKYEKTEYNDKIVNKFINLFLALTERIQETSDTKYKKICILERIYDIIYKFRNSIYNPELISEELFLKNTFEIIPNTIKIPDQTHYLLVSSVDGCATAPFGNYAKILITENLLFSVFNQKLKIEPEVISKLIGKTLYLRYSKETTTDFYCYKIQDFINFDYDLYELNLENYVDVVSGFDDSFHCCELEKNVKLTSYEKEIATKLSPELNLYSLSMYDLDREITLKLDITNKNYPYVKLNANEETFHVDEFLSNGDTSIPSFIFIKKTDSQLVNSLKITFDSENKNYSPRYIRYDFSLIKITDTLYENEVLVATTEYKHGFKVGDKVVIENSSKDSHLDGEHEIIGLVGQYKIILDYELPVGIEMSQANHIYADIKSLNSSKIYLDDLNSFSIGEKIVGHFDDKNTDYKIKNIKQDDLGKFLEIEGIIPYDTKLISKLYTTYNQIEYVFAKNPQIYNLNSLNIDTESYNLYVPKTPGMITKNILRQKVSSLSLITSAISSDAVEDEDLDIDIDNYSSSLKKKMYKQDEIAYHFSRTYLKSEFYLEGYDEVTSKTETYDWNNDGKIGIDEVKILERFLMTNPKSVAEYNINRENYPMASVLPNVVTALYACQENCCHDDFTESNDFSIYDVYIYDSFQTYVDSLGEDDNTEYSEFENYYDILVAQGIQEPLPETEQIIYMPTNPTEFKLCGDYTDSGDINAEDAHIYYAHKLYASANNGLLPETVLQFQTYYDTLVQSGIVPSLISPIKKLPSLSSDDTITIDTGELDKNCELISSKDAAIYEEWIRQGKPIDLDQFNENRLQGVPRACFLPVDDDLGPGDGDYEEHGTFVLNYDEIYSGIEHL